MVLNSNGETFETLWLNLGCMFNCQFLVSLILYILEDNWLASQIMRFSKDMETTLLTVAGGNLTTEGVVKIGFCKSGISICT